MANFSPDSPSQRAIEIKEEFDLPLVFIEPDLFELPDKVIIHLLIKDFVENTTINNLLWFSKDVDKVQPKMQWGILSYRYMVGLLYYLSQQSSNEWPGDPTAKYELLMTIPGFSCKYRIWKF